MKTFDIGAIRKKTDEQLAGASFDPKKLTLIYAGVVLAVSLVIALVDLVLMRSIGNTAGLSGIGMRSVLETIREVLQTGMSIALPFWEFGFIFTAMAMARGGDNSPKGLLEGFRRFGPVLRLRLQRGLLFIGVALACMYGGSILYYASPMASDLLTMLEPVMTENATVEQIEAYLAQIPTDQLMACIWPALVFGGVLTAIVLIPMFYRFRMADFYVMDEPRMLPMVAMITSSRKMRKNRMKWLLLDLSFWWYYLGIILSVLLCYGDTVLSWIGVELHMADDKAWMLFFLLGNVLLFVVDWLGRGKVQTAYALAYDVLRQQESEPEKPAPKNLPWDEYPTVEE